MSVAINHVLVAQVTTANTTPAKYLTKAQLYTNNISMFYISSCLPITITISTNIAELTE